MKLYYNTPYWLRPFVIKIYQIFGYKWFVMCKTPVGYMSSDILTFSQAKKECVTYKNKGYTEIRITHISNVKF